MDSVRTHNNIAVLSSPILECDADIVNIDIHHPAACPQLNRRSRSFELDGRTLKSRVQVDPIDIEITLSSVSAPFCSLR